MNDVLYLESDEEITSAIDKLNQLSGNEVSIVVPKRSTLLQSAVNQKLLKKAADDAGKKLILVTTDRSATHLAGMVGLPVASSLKAQAAVPQVDTTQPEDTEVLENEAEPESATPPAPEADEPPAEDDEPAEAGAVVPPAKNKPSYAKPMLVRKPVPAGEKKPTKIPNFDALQKRLLIGGGILGVILLLVLGNLFLKHATVTLYAKGTPVGADFNFTADPAAKQSNIPDAVLAAQALTLDKDLSTTLVATGKKDVGAKASGSMTITNYCFNPGTLPAGTTFTSGGGLKFVSTADVAIPDAVPHSGCNAPTTASVPVQATQNGDQYNLAPTTYSVGSAPQSSLKGSGGQMSGGLSKQITVVSQDDLNKAKQTVLDQARDGAKKDLSGKASSGYAMLDESFTETVGNVSSNPAVDQEASQAQVSVHVTYSGLAVNKNDYTNMIQTQEQKAVGNNNQIYDDGESQAKLTAGKKDSAGKQSFEFSSTAYAGAKIDTKAVAKQLADKKYGDAVDLASKVPGVDKATIDLWPGFTTKLPILSSHIKVVIKATNNNS